MRETGLPHWGPRVGTNRGAVLRRLAESGTCGFWSRHRPVPQPRGSRSLPTPTRRRKGRSCAPWRSRLTQRRCVHFCTGRHLSLARRTPETCRAVLGQQAGSGRGDAPDAGLLPVTPVSPRPRRPVLHTTPCAGRGASGTWSPPAFPGREQHRAGRRAGDSFLLRCRLALKSHPEPVGTVPVSCPDSTVTGGGKAYPTASGWPDGSGLRKSGAGGSNHVETPVESLTGRTCVCTQAAGKLCPGGSLVPHRG